jgi:hypothetical protein
MGRPRDPAELAVTVPYGPFPQTWRILHEKTRVHQSLPVTAMILSPCRIRFGVWSVRDDFDDESSPGPINQSNSREGISRCVVP